MENTLSKKLLVTSLLLIWVIPTLVICGSAWMTRTADVRVPSADRLALLFGTNLHIESVERPRPGLLRLKNVRLSFPGTEAPILHATSLTLSSHSDRDIWLVENAVTTCDGLRFLRQELEDRILLLVAERRQVSLSCEELIIREEKGRPPQPGERSETSFQIAGTPVWTGRLEVEIEPSVRKLHVRLFDRNSANVSGASPHGPADSPDSPSATAHATALLEWSLWGTPEGISERLAVNASLPLSLVEPWLPTSVFNAQWRCYLTKNRYSCGFQGPTVTLAVGQIFPPNKSSFSGTIVSTGIVATPGTTQWHVSVTGQVTWHEASPGLVGILGDIPHKTGKMEILHLDAINDRLISGDCLIHLGTGVVRIGQTITTWRILKQWFSTPEIVDENSSCFSSVRFAEYEMPAAPDEAYQARDTGRPRAASLPSIDDGQQFGEDEGDSPSAGIIPFDYFQLRVIWDAEGIQLLPAATRDSSWIVARWQGLPVLALNSDALGARIPWDWILQQGMTRSEEPGASWRQ